MWWGGGVRTRACAYVAVWCVCVVCVVCVCVWCVCGLRSGKLEEVYDKVGPSSFNPGAVFMTPPPLLPPPPPPASSYPLHLIRRLLLSSSQGLLQYLSLFHDNKNLQPLCSSLLVRPSDEGGWVGGEGWGGWGGGCLGVFFWGGWVGLFPPACVPLISSCLSLIITCFCFPLREANSFLVLFFSSKLTRVGL